MMDHVVTDAAKDCSSDSIETSGSDDDHSGFLSLCHVDDSLTWRLVVFSPQLIWDLEVL